MTSPVLRFYLAKVRTNLVAFFGLLPYDRMRTQRDT